MEELGRHTFTPHEEDPSVQPPEIQIILLKDRRIMRIMISGPVDCPKRYLE